MRRIWIVSWLTDSFLVDSSTGALIESDIFLQLGIPLAVAALRAKRGATIWRHRAPRDQHSMVGHRRARPDDQHRRTGVVGGGGHVSHRVRQHRRADARPTTSPASPTLSDGDFTTADGSLSGASKDGQRCSAPTWSR
jgi:hypothetical protein